MKLDNEFVVQGIALGSLVDKYGSPLYVYDADRIRNQYHRLLTAFAGVDLSIRYAGKALSNINILALFKKWGAGLDAVSIEEVLVGIEVGFEPGKIIFTPSCVSFDEIKSAVEKGVVINIESLSTLEHFGRYYGSSVPCCIRLNPNIAAGGNPKIQTGHDHSKFGISLHLLPRILTAVAAYKIEVAGLHAHTGSEITVPEAFLKEAEILYRAALEFPDLRFLDFGSGFKVPYHSGDVATDIADLAGKMIPRFSEFCREYGKKLAMWIEPGKFLVSEAGYFLVRTNVVKETACAVFAGVNSGFNHLIRPMLYDAYHEIINISNPKGPRRIYSVVGYICEEDTFARDREIAEIREGDILCLGNAGAYGFSMSSNYNSRPRPAEVLILNRRDYLIREAETLADILRHQIRLDIV